MKDLFGFDIQEDAAKLHKERLNNYAETHCFQYDIRLKNRQEDLLYSGLTEEDVCKMHVDDFAFEIAKTDDEIKKCYNFIKRQEWLGTIAQYTTHCFYAKYRDIYAGVILMGVPNAFSKVIGEDTYKYERLISRGACISWSPKNLASCLLMWSIKWMVHNTDYRVFSAYSDPTARELGSIYQACNFYYLGNNYGTTTRYINPYTNKIVSDRLFRQKTAYKKYAERLGIEWGKDWIVNNKINWDSIPIEIATKLRKESKNVQRQSKTIEYPSKHKYLFILGKDKRETNRLRNMFLSQNKIYPYPKERGK